MPCILKLINPLKNGYCECLILIFKLAIKFKQTFCSFLRKCTNLLFTCEVLCAKLNKVGTCVWHQDCMMHYR